VNTSIKRCLIVSLLVCGLSQAAHCQHAQICYVQSSRIYSETVDLRGKTLRKSVPIMLYDLRSSPIGVSNCSLIGRNEKSGQVYISSGNNIWSIAQRKAVKVLSDANDPAASPTGDKIAFDRGMSVYVADTKSFTAKLLSNGGCEPCWSADGKRIACAPDSKLAA